MCIRDRKGIAESEDLLEQVIWMLEAHAMIEERIFYPDLEPGEVAANEQVHQAYAEHDEVKSIISEIRGAEDEEELERLFMMLRQNVLAHVEKEESDIFAAAERALGMERLEEAGVEAEALKEKIESGDVDAEDIPDTPTMVMDEEQPPA